MTQRPWPIVILAALHFFAPVGNFFFSAFLQKVSLTTYFSALFNFSEPFQLIQFFVPSMLAGWAIYRCKSWSYPLFLGVGAWNLFVNVSTLRAQPQAFPIPVFLVTTAVDLAVVGYFLLPAVRTMYLNPKVRWWESKPRYAVQFPVVVEVGGYVRAGLATDISEGGVMITTKEPLPRGKNLKISFDLFNYSHHLKGTVAHQRDTGEVSIYGIKFEHCRQTTEKCKNLIAAIDVFGAKRKTLAAYDQRFSDWLKTALTTGRGLVPETKAPQTPRGPSPTTESRMST